MHTINTTNTDLEPLSPDLPLPASDLATWREAIAAAVVPLEIQAKPGTTFAGHIRSSAVDGVGVYELLTTAHTVRRTPKLISKDDSQFYKLSLQLSGRGILEQDGRRAELGPGDLAIYDTHRPYALHFPEPSRTMVMVIPREPVELTAEQIARVTATCFSSDRGFGRLINPFFVELCNSIEQLPGAYGARLVHSALDLMVTMLAHELDTRSGGPSSPTGSLHREIREYILNHLGDETMTPASIAAAHFVSLRYLYTIFAEEGETISAWIRARRLEHIRRDLVDPIYAQRPVSWVAGRWGLHDAAHFSRLFKAEYGESPSVYRRQRLAGGSLAA
ncbi:helix-turn-helix domain-containing protein [Nesterenkonia sp. AY15]|uniref:AraC-like ligand-binding domain-containing protein n=1 Tax=Nesterenkonia sp. AY15 TaxID=2901139 RepID=UPI001F4CFEC8|nr:helix-turn-helix domain-containing protein [Nesterenkonia sp. AY15]MCH8571474.1 helix-turn-helix domain-containing protein [Nesterenkonia sp. AY15]